MLAIVVMLIIREICTGTSLQMEVLQDELVEVRELCQFMGWVGKQEQHQRCRLEWCEGRWPVPRKATNDAHLERIVLHACISSANLPQLRSFGLLFGFPLRKHKGIERERERERERETQFIK